MREIRMALMAVTIMTISSLALCQETSNEYKDLEKQLSALDQQWEWSNRPNRAEYFKQLFTEQWVEEAYGIPTNRTKAEHVARISKATLKPGEGHFVDEFKLRAVYGNVALATDRRLFRTIDPNSQFVTTPYRCLLIFVKEKGKWKVGGGGLTPIVSP